MATFPFWSRPVNEIAPTFLMVIFGIVVLYFISAELTKYWSYREAKNNG